MDETIDLRELLETIWKGKWVIGFVTAVFVLIAAVVSWFFLPEQYESNATFQVASEVQDTGIMSSYVAAEFTPIIFSQRIKNEVLMNKAFKENGILESFDTSNISATVQANTNLVDLKYKSTSGKDAQEQLTLLINKAKEQMNDSVKGTLNELEKTYTSEAKQLSNEIEMLIGKYNEKIISNALPEILIMQTLVSSQIILTVSDEQTQELAKVNGSLHNDLMQMQTQVASKSAEYRNVLDKYQSVKTGLDSFRPDPFIRAIVEPTKPNEPLSPNKLLNVAVALILGLMSGLGVLFFRQYWKTSAVSR